MWGKSYVGTWSGNRFQSWDFLFCFNPVPNNKSWTLIWKGLPLPPSPTVLYWNSRTALLLGGSVCQQGVHRRLTYRGSAKIFARLGNVCWKNSRSTERCEASWACRSLSWVCKSAIFTIFASYVVAFYVQLRLFRRQFGPLLLTVTFDAVMVFFNSVYFFF